MTMRDRMARAMEEILITRLLTKRLDGYTLETSKALADAALEALREPTYAMQAAAKWKPGDQYQAASTWRDMHDAILAEKD